MTNESTTARGVSPSAQRGRDLLQVLETHGIRWMSGVPCSLLAELFHAMESNHKIRYVPAAREDAALAFAAGCYLAGTASAVALQNSGLGHIVNPLTSLTFVYDIPTLLIIGWRGRIPERDSPEHSIMGPMTTTLLDTLGVRHFVVDADNVVEQAQRATRYMEESKERRAVALLVGPGVLES